MLSDLLCSNLNCLLSIGLILFFIRFTWSIEFLVLSLRINLLMSCYSLIHLLMMIWRLLGLYALTQHLMPADPSLTYVFIGFKHAIKGYVLLDLQSRSIFFSRHVLLYEHLFPFHDINTPTLMPLPQDHTIPNYDDTYDSSPPTNIASPTQIDISTRRSFRPRKLPSYLQDYHCNLIHNSTVSLTYLNVSSPHHHSSILSYDHLSLKHKHFTLSIYVTTEPKKYNQAIKHDC